MTNKLPPLRPPEELFALKATRGKPFRYYTTEQMREYGQQCRDSALEEAAERCKANDLKAESEGVRLTLTAAHHIIGGLK